MPCKLCFAILCFQGLCAHVRQNFATAGPEGREEQEHEAGRKESCTSLSTITEPHTHTIRGGRVANHVPKSARGATVFGWLFYASICFAVLWFALLLYALLISALIQVG